MPDEDIQASHIEEAVDSDRVEFDDLKKQDGLSILQIPDKLEDISNAFLSRFEYFISWHNDVL